jgi:hypothetical protein
MDEYHKIDSIFKRDQRGNFIISQTVNGDITGEFSRPEFQYLADKNWEWTEKVDGTNIRIMWDGARAGNVTFGGKTDNAQIPAKLVTWLNANISAKSFFDACLEDSLCLYGEGYGAGIQNGGNYSVEQKFILFDVKIGNWWLERDNVVDIAKKLGLEVVPTVFVGTIFQAIELTKVGFKSMISPKANSEGLVGTPVVPLFARNGDRIITKVKTADFKVK